MLKRCCESVGGCWFVAGWLVMRQESIMNSSQASLASQASQFLIFNFEFLIAIAFHRISSHSSRAAHSLHSLVSSLEFRAGTSIRVL